MSSQSSSDRLSALLGFDPAKGGDASGPLQEAMQEIAKEQAEKRKSAAKALLEEAVKVRMEMDSATKAFHNQKNKFEGTLGKLLNRLEQMAAGGRGDDTQAEAPEPAPVE